MKKNSCTPINHKKIFMLWPKKNSYKEFDNEKKFLRLENSPPPHKFSNGPSLRGVVLRWFNNYLSNREQVVKYKTSISNKMTVKCGVPQDSILGPLLFVIYVNNIKNSSQILSFMFLPMILIYS